MSEFSNDQAMQDQSKRVIENSIEFRLYAAQAEREFEAMFELAREMLDGAVSPKALTEMEDRQRTLDVLNRKMSESNKDYAEILAG